MESRPIQGLIADKGFFQQYWMCERFVRQTLQKFIIPGQFRLTTGFITKPELLGGHANLPQCDILIVANNTPPLLQFEDSDIEVVP
jgi:hypothetical protein